MTAHLLFVPGASPTYVPLGIASLAAWLAREVPALPLQVRDLNIALWERIDARLAGQSLAPLFLKGLVGNFYDEGQYQNWLEPMAALYREWHRLEEELQQELRGGAATEGGDWYRQQLAEQLQFEAGDDLLLSALYPQQLLHAVWISRWARARQPDLRILIGGAALSAIDLDEFLLALPEVDAIYRGEGEEALSRLYGGEPLLAIPGFSRLDHGLPHHAPKSKGPDITTLPIPDFGFAELERYWNPEPVLPLVFSRSCRWKRCRFCSHNFSFARYRCTSYGHFADQVEALIARHPVRHFYLADQYVGADDLAGISQALLDRGLDIRFHVMGRPTVDYSPEILELAFRAGCRWISWGVESGAGQLLDDCDKGTTPEGVARVLHDANEAGISNLAMMIFGLPGTSDASFQQTLDWAAAVTDTVDAFTSSSFQLFAHTPFFIHRDRFRLHPVEREVLLWIDGLPVHSNRWSYGVVDDQGGVVPPPGGHEVELWHAWRSWVRGGERFLEHLPAEHYLLHSSHRAITSLGPSHYDDTRPGRHRIVSIAS